MTSLFSISSQMSQIQLVISLHSDSPKPRVVAAGVPILIPLVTNDPQSPFVTSGIRIGTPAVTTRGLKQDDMAKIVDLIDRVIINIENDSELEKVKAEVNSMMSGRPLFKA